MTTDRCPGNLCAHFTGPTFTESEGGGVDSLLHDFCQDCSSRAGQEPLCDFCAHLRLHHLAICLREKLTSLRINLDSAYNKPGSGISRILSTTRCAICNFLAKVIHSYFVMSKKHEENEGGMRANTTLFLSLRQRYGDHRLILTFRTYAKNHEIEIIYREPTNDWKPEIGEQVGWPTVQKWIEKCTRHPHCTRLEVSEVPQGFRLVDVEKQKLVSDFPSGSELGRDIKFVALSYVWGKPAISRTDALLGSNNHQLTAPGGLEKLSLPKAIQDAITVCQRLHQRFLWIDRLCIQQDDNGPEKQTQIDAMGKIYSSAEFTIIHASGVSMEDPIAGVTTNRKIFQFRAVVCGLELISGYPDITVLLQGSRWNERGWTYQEAILSRRKLFFTPFELWLECSDSHDAYKREEQCSTRRLGNRLSRAKIEFMTQYGINGFAKDTTKFHDFVRHLESYTKRSLTYQSDILNAFLGILTTLYDGGSSIYGLPEADFDQAMLWHGDTKRRLTVVVNNFPSWSWASVAGVVTAPETLLGTEGFLGTLVQWYYQDRNGVLKHVISKNSLLPRKYPDTGAQAYILVAWWKGCVEPTVPDDVKQELEKCPAACQLRVPSEPTWTKPNWAKLRFIETIGRHIEHREDCTTCQSQIAQRWPYLEDVWKDIQRDRDAGLGVIQDLTTGAQKEERQLFEKLRPGVLVTRAQTTCFKASITTREQYTEMSLADSTRRRIGTICPKYANTGLEEFSDIVKSEEASAAITVECMDVSLSDYEYANRDRPTVNVLIIHRKEGSPFWRRIAVGWVYLADWIKADRVFKTIGLE